jgi:hypothetical protein
MVELRQLFTAYLAVACLLLGSVTYLAPAIHVLTAHADHYDSAPSHPVGSSHEHEEAGHDPLDHSHQLVPNPDAVRAGGTSTPLVDAVPQSSLVSTALPFDALRSLPPENHARAGPPPHFLRSQLNL